MGLGDRPSIRQVEGSAPELINRSRLMDFFQGLNAGAPLADYAQGQIDNYRRYVTSADAPKTAFDHAAEWANVGQYVHALQAEEEARRQQMPDPAAPPEAPFIEDYPQLTDGVLTPLGVRRQGETPSERDLARSQGMPNPVPGKVMWRQPDQKMQDARRRWITNVLFGSR